MVVDFSGRDTEVFEQVFHGNLERLVVSIDGRR